jgi:hypothetical protein
LCRALVHRNLEFKTAPENIGLRGHLDSEARKPTVPQHDAGFGTGALVTAGSPGSYMARFMAAIPQHGIGRRPWILGAVLCAAAALSGCGSANSVGAKVGSMGSSVEPAMDTVGHKIGQTLPVAAGGMPADLPPAPANRPDYLAVHDMPPERPVKRMTVDERKKLEADLKTLREHQEQLNPGAQATAASGPQPASPPPVAQAGSATH